MTEKSFANRIANSQSDFIQEFVNILEEHHISFCIIGGLAVNAYAEPVVSLDMDVVIASDRIDELLTVLSETRFSVAPQSHSINISSSSSDFRIQLQTEPRYQEFIASSSYKTILGYKLPVTSAEDVLQSKIWAFSDPTRRASKRQKDLADILRLIEAQPALISLLPSDLKERLTNPSYPL
ncbi:MAG: hypothetical protein AB1393_01120 [Candidatus Edwardsbacteria bacterium]